MTQENNKKNTAGIEKLFPYLVHLFPPSIIGWKLWLTCFTLPLEYLIFPLFQSITRIFIKRRKGPRTSEIPAFLGGDSRDKRSGALGMSRSSARYYIVILPKSQAAFPKGRRENQHFSKMVATPWPPPMHRVARPFLASSRFCISWSRVTIMRAPEAPTG